MSAFDTSSFYSFDNSGNEGSPVSEMEHDAQIFDAAIDNPQGPVTPPPYDMNAGYGGQPTTESPVSDPSFLPGQAPVSSGFEFKPWMLLAAGAALVILMRDDKKRGYE